MNATEEEQHLAWRVYHGDDVGGELVRVAGSLARARELMRFVLAAAQAEVVAPKVRRRRVRATNPAVTAVNPAVT